MLVCLVGLPHSGRRTVAAHLEEAYGFTRLECGGGEADAEAALAQATAQWRRRLVAVAPAAFAVSAWRRRPFVLVVAVRAPALVRHARALRKKKKAQAHDDEVYERQQPHELIPLADFVRADDELLFPGSGEPHLALALRAAAVTITNAEDSLAALHAQIVRADILSDERLRPRWDVYFMRLCDLAATRSNCMKRRVGCVVARNRRVVATGYNGTPVGLPNCSEGGCRRCNDAVATRGVALTSCICLHAEENALLEAGRDRIAGGGADPAVLYCNTCPCILCTRKIIQVGVKEVVYGGDYGGGMDEICLGLFREAGVSVRKLQPEPEFF